MEVHSLDTTQDFNIDTSQDHFHNWRSILIGYHLWESLIWYNTSLDLIQENSSVLILIVRINLILLTIFTIQHHHLNHMRIHRTLYDSQVLLDITHKSREWLLMLYNQHSLSTRETFFYLPAISCHTNII